MSKIFIIEKSQLPQKVHGSMQKMIKVMDVGKVQVLNHGLLPVMRSTQLPLKVNKTNCSQR